MRIIILIVFISLPANVTAADERIEKFAVLAAYGWIDYDQSTEAFFERKGNFIEAGEKLRSLMYDYGMSGEDVVTQMYREVIAMPEKELPSKRKIELVDKIGEYNFRLVEGANERIQLEALLAQFMKKDE